LSTWSWIASRREREVLLKSLEHLSKVRDVVQHFIEMLNGIERGDLGKAAEEYRLVYTIEEDADKIKRSIIEYLSKGFLHPLDREDLMRLVLSCDDIAAYVKASARKLNLLYKLELQVPSEAVKCFKDISLEILRAVDDLVEAVKEITRSIEKTIALTHEVERIEEKIDEMRLESFKIIHSLCSESFNFKCIMLKEIIDDLEMASDKCEDVADVLRMIAVSHS